MGNTINLDHVSVLLIYFQVLASGYLELLLSFFALAKKGYFVIFWMKKKTSCSGYLEQKASLLEFK